MRILITGASGLLGTWLLRTVPADVRVIAGIHETALSWPEVVQADLRDPRQARTLVEDARPDLIIHAAYRKDPISIVDASANVATAATASGAHTLLMSTDVVFPGDGQPRSEADRPDPVSDYGRWKTEAESMVRRQDPRAVIVRTSLLVSLDPPDQMVQRVYQTAKEGGTVGWYAEERRQPAHASDVARAIWQIALLPKTVRPGVWHLPGPERLTRRELGARVAAAIGVRDPGTEIEPPPRTVRPRALYLTDQRARQEIAWKPRPVLTEAGQRNC